MKDQLEVLILYALSHNASDIHFLLQDDRLEISLRTVKGYIPLVQDLFDERLLEYLKFISGMDLCSKWIPQSGHFEWDLPERSISCRFSILENRDLCTGVLRLLAIQKDLPLDSLCSNPQAIDYLHSLLKLEHGLVISAGPTGSGKTTTLHAILHEIALHSHRKIITLEDPIEILDDLYLQLEINERQGFTYEKGLTELLRHDPDILLIGEVRSAEAARTLIQAGLSGHLVFCTLHAGTGEEILYRLQEFGISKEDLKTVITAMFAQRLLEGKKGKECIYERWTRKDVENYFESGNTTVLSLEGEIEYARSKGWIYSEKNHTDSQKGD